MTDKLAGQYISQLNVLKAMLLERLIRLGDGVPRCAWRFGGIGLFALALCQSRARLTSLSAVLSTSNSSDFPHLAIRRQQAGVHIAALHVVTQIAQTEELLLATQ